MQTARNWSRRHSKKNSGYYNPSPKKVKGITSAQKKSEPVPNKPGKRIIFVEY